MNLILKIFCKKEAFIISRSYIGKTFHSKFSKPTMIMLEKNHQGGNGMF